MNNFYQPKNEKELIDILKLKDENTFFLAGGTDVMIEVKQNKMFDKDFIDLTKLSQLDFIQEYDDRVEIGAMTKIQDIADSDIIKDRFYALSFSTRHIGSRQIRNRATIGGNIANASQSADTLPVLFSLNACVELINSKGERRIMLAEDFVIGKGKTNICKDELITKISLPKKSRFNYFAKLGSRKEVTISKINCSANFIIEKGIIKESSIYLGAIGIKPIRAEKLEKYFENKSINQIEDDSVREIGFDIVEMAIPTRQSKYYKRHAISGVLSDILTNLRSDYEV